MTTRIEKIVSTVLHEARRRKVEFYKTFLD
jgi:hypothetical protein